MPDDAPIMFPDKVQTLRLPLQDIQEDPRNPNVMPLDRFEAAKRHIELTGKCPPLVVRSLNPTSQFWNPKGKDEQYMLLDGQHRRRMLTEIGYQEWDVHLWEGVDDVNAGLYLATLNRNVGEDDPVKRADLVISLNEIIPLSDIALIVPETELELEALMEYRQDVQALDLGLIGRVEEEEDKEAAYPLRFVLFPAQYEILGAALLHLERQIEGRNKPGRALTQLAEMFLGTLPEEVAEALKTEMRAMMNDQPTLDDGKADDFNDDPETNGFKD